MEKLGEEKKKGGKGERGQTTNMQGEGDSVKKKNAWKLRGGKSPKFVSSENGGGLPLSCAAKS